TFHLNDLPLEYEQAILEVDDQTAPDTAQMTDLN
ncbi:MAG: cytochrome c oxidase assembly protein subunit 11, partial [Octadecabacter sp.]